MILCLLRPFSDKNSTLFARMIGPLGLKILGVDFEILGREHLEGHRPCVFIGNHQNNYDIFIVCSFIPSKTVSLGKSELLWIPLFGLFYWLSGNIVVTRGNRTKSLQAMEKVKQYIIEKKLSIVIMPEGTRSLGRGLLPFKKGAFHTAAYANVPVVPFCVSSWDSFIDLNKWKAGKLYIKGMPPLKATGTSPKEVEVLMTQARTVMENEIMQLNNNLIQTTRV